jgi:hypothetical protein
MVRRSLLTQKINTHTKKKKIDLLEKEPAWKREIYDRSLGSPTAGPIRMHHTAEKIRKVVALFVTQYALQKAYFLLLSARTKSRVCVFLWNPVHSGLLSEN